jgi:hypothetical protein
LLQGLDAAAERRLGHEGSLGRTAEGTCLGNGQEMFKVPDVHGELTCKAETQT